MRARGCLFYGCCIVECPSSLQLHARAHRKSCTGLASVLHTAVCLSPANRPSAPRAAFAVESTFARQLINPGETPSDSPQLDALVYYDTLSGLVRDNGFEQVILRGCPEVRTAAKEHCTQDENPNLSCSVLKVLLCI